MDPELQRQAAEVFRRVVDGGGTQEQATRVARLFLDQQGGPATESPGVVSGTLRSAAQGATFGFSDELRGAGRAARALLPGGRPASEAGAAFSEGVEAEREGLSAFRREHPVLATAGELVGGVATGVGTGLALTRSGVTAARVGIPSLMRLGAAEGAAAGLGYSEGNVVERLPGAATGAVTGGILAGVFPAVGRGVSSAATRALDITGLRPRGTPGVLGRAAQRLGVSSVEDRAASRLAAALPEGEALETAARELSGTTRPLGMMDVNENVAGVARAARGVRGEAKHTLPAYLASRTAGQESRILDDALRLTGASERASIFETTQEIVERRAARARPLYEAAYERSVPRNVLGDIDMVRDPVWRDAYERGIRIAQREGVDIRAIAPELIDGAPFAADVQIPVQAIDYMKRGLDDVIDGKYRSANGMVNQEGRALRTQLRQLLGRVDDAVPQYGEARAAFAGESALLDALEEGRNLWKMDPAAARAALAKLPESEREMFVRGGLEEMAARIEDTASSSDLTRRRPLGDRTRDRQRLRLLFPDDATFEQFQRSIAEEAQIARTDRFVTGGSNTADKLAELADLAGVNLSTVLAGNVTGMMGQLAGSALARRAQGFSGELGEAMLPDLTAEGPAAAAAMRRLAGLRAEVGQRLSRRERAVAGAAGVLGGSAAGRE